jgi:hypothetical protein
MTGGITAELGHQRGVGAAFHAAFGDDDTGGGGNQQSGDLRDQPVTDGQGGESVRRVIERHAVPEQTHQQAADDVDRGDQQAGDGVAADEFGGAVHGTIKAAFLFQRAAAVARDFFIDQAGVEVGIDRHLLAGHGVQAEPCRDFGDAAGAFRDDHEIHDEQDGEQDQADHDVAAHQESAERGDHMTGGERTFAAMAEDQPGGGDVERQAQQRRQQQQLRKAGEIQRAFEEERDHQHQHGGRDGQ